MRMNYSRSAILQNVAKHILFLDQVWYGFFTDQRDDQKKNKIWTNGA